MNPTSANFGSQGPVPLVPGSIYGARAWRFMPGGQLRALSRDYLWISGENSCSCGHFASHREPKLDCSCGFYAYFTGGLSHAGPEVIVGVIQAYGKVIYGNRGFRCEKAKIVAIYNPWADGSPKPDVYIERPGAVRRELENELYATMCLSGLDLGHRRFRQVELTHPNIPQYASPMTLLRDYPVTMYSEMESIDSSAHYGRTEFG